MRIELIQEFLIIINNRKYLSAKQVVLKVFNPYFILKQWTEPKIDILETLATGPIIFHYFFYLYLFLTQYTEICMQFFCNIDKNK